MLIVLYRIASQAFVFFLRCSQHLMFIYHKHQYLGERKLEAAQLIHEMGFMKLIRAHAVVFKEKMPATNRGSCYVFGHVSLA